MAATHGLARRVVVQASVSGRDNAVTLDAAEALGAARAECVAGPEDDLAALARRGCVGLCFNIARGNGAPVEAMEAVAARVADLGWHLQIYARPEMLGALMPRLLALPVPLVLDHWGSARAGEPASWQPVLWLLGAGRAWCRLSGTRAGATPEEVGPPARRLVAGAPGRCVWGTVWPHARHARPADVPEDAALLEALQDWVPEERDLDAVLVRNPARLCGFA